MESLNQLIDTPDFKKNNKNKSIREEIYNDFRVLIMGPNTFAAYLISIHMGFKSLSINERAKDIVKDLGNKFERQVIEVARSIVSTESLSSSISNNMQFSTVLSEGMLRLPSFTIRGGTTEIMRSIIARGLGLR